MPVLLGWANSWRYANDIPTYPWKSAMALPRNLSLRNINGEWVLIQKPLKAFNSLRKILFSQSSFSSKAQYNPGVQSMQFEMEFQLEPGQDTLSGVRIARSSGDYLEMGYDNKSGEWYIDRSHSKHPSFNKEFDKYSRFAGKVRLNHGKIDARVFADQSIVELYLNDGENVFTIQIFSLDDSKKIEFFSSNSGAKFSNIKIWEMGSVWHK